MADSDGQQRFELLLAEGSTRRRYAVDDTTPNVTLSASDRDDEDDVERRARLRLIAGATAGPFVWDLAQHPRGGNAQNPQLRARDVDEWGHMAATPRRALAYTRASLVPEIVARANADHPYDVPCVVAFPIMEGNPDYLSWINAETRERTQQQVTP